MIVEDENGNDIDLNDLRDQEREPDEPTEPEPLDLDWIESVYTESNGTLDANACQVMADTVPGLVAEVKTLREELAYWRALPIRAEYATAVGGNTHPDDCKQAWHTEDSDQAQAWHKNVPDSRMWTRSVTVHEWVELSSEPPV